MIKLFVEELKEMYAVLDDAIQNSDHTDFDQCYWALDELCKHALHLHQKWRRGAINEMPLTAKEYGEALDEAIRLLRQYDRQQDNGAVR